LSEKIKITKKEVNDLYDIQDEQVEKINKEQTDKDAPNASISFEDYTVAKDKEDDKKWRLEDEEE